MSAIPVNRASDRSADLTAGGAALGGRWSVVPAQSVARFHVRDKLVATVHGTMPVQDGAVFVSADGDVERAWVEVSAVGIDTGNAHRDSDVRKPRFLDAAHHPCVRVDVQQVASTAAGWTARATVAAKKGRVPVDLTVATVAQAGDEIRCRVTGRLDRAPLGIKVPAFFVGRFIDVEAELTFHRETGTPRKRSV